MSEQRQSDHAEGMFLQVSRIGYPDEGIRFTVACGFPYDYHSEIQLSRGDALWLIAALKEELKRKDLP
jgi:hypothetical protein